MAHRFDPANLGRLDSPEREELVKPEVILRSMGVKAGDIFLDYGCGTGFFARKALEIIGSGGFLYALDISQEMLRVAHGKLTAFSNIRYMPGDGDTIPLDDMSIDFAFMGFVLHEVEDKTRLLDEMMRILKTGGHMGIVEWDKKEMEQGPPAADRIAVADLEKMLQEHGFRDIIRRTTNPLQYYITAGKN